MLQQLLYSMGYENDRLCIVQSLLLLSYWQEIHDEPANHWYWAELGCTVARSIGLYQDPDSSNMSDRQKHLWKRVGWSCMLRDRVLNMGVRMPPKIKPSEFYLPLLNEDDFDIGIHPTPVTEMLSGCKLLQDLALQSRLARICIEKCKLCLLLGRVFESLYTDSSPKLGATREVTLILLPKAPDITPEKVQDIERELNTWQCDLAGDMQYQQLHEPLSGDSDKIALVHCSLVLMFHQAIMCTFYRPQLLAPAPSSFCSHEWTKQKSNYATLTIARRFEDLQTYGLLRFLPSSSVTFLLTAAVNHLVEYKTVKDEDCKSQQLRRFRDCLCYLKPLQGVHIYAKYAGIFLHSAGSQAGIDMWSESANRKSSSALNSAQISVDSDTLGPWAVAHTPDELLIRPQANIRSIRRRSATPSTAIGSTASRRPDASEMDTTSPLGSNSFTSPGQRNDIPMFQYVDADALLSSTIWEHGWLDEVVEKWPEYLADTQALGQW